MFTNPVLYSNLTSQAGAVEGKQLLYFLKTQQKPNWCVPSAPRKLSNALLLPGLRARTHLKHG